ncbi:FKBP-type peptidyl-prolyl cis-trans isomerase [Paraglaciecola arctica]|uniref:Peptidyl-prolyl cis-trans isomerase n=1 Tax=Paraglaciecola arctica BSs20135 TaxID=493475 RepID=K6XBE8_9ALTE|nr:FKBP-type peptidyl-prolyl cis-trans isomerase [Paraglaciecola arctica]GAC17944.1 FKBP-type peptidyl-prolyl cis-trans isomerase FkpA [Paraglaciecola arctica BSs20135]
MKKAAIAILIVSVLSLNACQPPPVDPMKVEILVLDTEQQKQSYALGASIGQIIENKMASQKVAGIEYDQNILVKGFIAALQGQSQLENKEIQAITRTVESLVRDKKIGLKTQVGDANKTKGIEFLTNNAKRAGIVVTDTGLQYEILKNGEGGKPKVSDTVTVNYLGTLLDGTEFDSSYSRNKPATFPLNRVIKGWTEGVQLMNVGAKYKFYVPSDLAYGSRSTGKISSNSTLIFEVELLEIVETGNPATR